MPQNWWEMYPEVVPSPAARPRSMPMLGGIMPAPAMSAQPGWLGGIQYVPQGQFDDFNPGHLPGSDFANARPDPTLAQPAFSGARAGLATDRNAIVQQAAAAIQRGADPKAVRSRLNEVRFGGGDLSLLDSFSDLVPSDPQGGLVGQMPAQPGAAQQRFGAAQTPLQNRPMSYLSAAKTTDQMSALGKFSKLTTDTKSAGMAAASQPDQSPDDPFTPENPLMHMMAADERAIQPDHTPSVSRRPDPYSEANLTLGPNEQYRAAILAAARFYHLTPQGVAATVGTEMLPGRWNPNANNGVAVGLSQFKAATWIGEAERRGSFLNRVAGQLGYLDSHGRMIPARRQQFLAVRNNPEASIWAASDYAAYNLNVLRREGYILNESPAALARYAYIAHHEGLAGARRFLRGDVNINERQFLQNIQRPADRARYLAANGNDRNRAYRDFHANLVDGRVDVTQYMANRNGVEVPPTRSLYR